MIEATVTGNVGRPPELKTTRSGKTMANFSVASTFKNGDKEITTWIDVVCFDEQADVVAETLSKGDRVIVTGRLDLEQYQKKDGTPGSSLRMMASDVGQSLRWHKRDGSGPRVSREEAQAEPEFAVGEIPF
jgi:single-strand DNA-binding protein